MSETNEQLHQQLEALKAEVAAIEAAEAANASAPAVLEEAAEALTETETETETLAANASTESTLLTQHNPRSVDVVISGVRFRNPA